MTRESVEDTWLSGEAAGGCCIGDAQRAVAAAAVAVSAVEGSIEAASCSGGRGLRLAPDHTRAHLLDVGRGAL